MTSLALDTWAFVELALDRPRAPEVAKEIEASQVFTVREVVGETYGFLLNRAGAMEARAWLDALMEDQVPILAPAVLDIHASLRRLPKSAGLSFVDVSLALAALERGAKNVATGDREFARMRLVPLFAT